MVQFGFGGRMFKSCTTDCTFVDVKQVPDHIPTNFVCILDDTVAYFYGTSAAPDFLTVMLDMGVYARGCVALVISKVALAVRTLVNGSR